MQTAKEWYLNWWGDHFLNFIGGNDERERGKGGVLG